jgi:hypothetical protein
VTVNVIAMKKKKQKTKSQVWHFVLGDSLVVACVLLAASSSVLPGHCDVIEIATR